MGFILLEGGAEFGGRMADADRQAVKLAGGFDTPIRIMKLEMIWISALKYCAVASC